MSALAIALLSAVVSGCARYQYVNVRSEPAGADVFLDGEQIGRTPLVVAVDRTRDHIVFLKLDGHVPEREVLLLNRAPDAIDFLTPADVELSLGQRPGAAREKSREVEVQLERPDGLRAPPEESR